MYTYVRSPDRRSQTETSTSEVLEMSGSQTDPSAGPEPFMEKAPRWQAIVDGVREHGEAWAQAAPAHR
jgi:hypothetical protein